jgi:hypothetical protein
MDIWLASYLALWTLVGIETIILVILLRHIGVVYLGTRDGISRDGLPIGSAIPDAIGYRLDGREIHLRDLSHEWLVLVFASPGCEDCYGLLPELQTMKREFDGLVQLAFLFRGTVEDARAIPSLLQSPIEVIAIGRAGVAEQFRVRVSPFVHVVGRGGTVLAKGAINGRHQLEHLLLTAGLRHPLTISHERHLAGAATEVG